MSYRELIESLSLEAEEERRKLLESAADEATRIMEQARQELGRLPLGPMAEAEAKISADRAVRLLGARLEAEGELLRAKNDLIDSVRRRVVELWDEFAESPEYGDCFKQLLREATAGIEGGTVFVRPRDRKLAAAALGNPASFSIETDAAMAPGVRVVSPDGRVEADNTFPARLARYLPWKEAEIARSLFGDS